MLFSFIPVVRLVLPRDSEVKEEDDDDEEEEMVEEEEEGEEGEEDWSTELSE